MGYGAYRPANSIYCGSSYGSRASRADVSFIAGVLVDNFAYHLPLYRQHQRLLDAGFTLSRPWLTQLVQQVAGLLEPIYEAQLASIRAIRVRAMDETPIKAGPGGWGQAQAGLLLADLGRGRRSLLPLLREPPRRARAATLGS